MATGFCPPKLVPAPQFCSIGGWCVVSYMPCRLKWLMLIFNCLSATIIPTMAAMAATTPTTMPAIAPGPISSDLASLVSTGEVGRISPAAAVLEFLLAVFVLLGCILAADNASTVVLMSAEEETAAVTESAEEVLGAVSEEPGPATCLFRASVVRTKAS